MECDDGLGWILIFCCVLGLKSESDRPRVDRYQSATRRLDRSHREVVWHAEIHIRRQSRDREKLRGLGRLPASSGSCAQMKLRRHHLGTPAMLEGRKYSDAAAAGVADRHDTIFDGNAAFALALFT
jgi:hypothetical protein